MDYEGQKWMRSLLAFINIPPVNGGASLQKGRKDRSVQKVMDKILTVLGVIPALLLLYIVLSTSINVFARYLGFGGLVWGVQFTEYSLLWMTLLGASWVLKRDKHVTVDLITGLLKERAMVYFNVVHSIMGFAVCALLCWYGAIVTWGQYQRGVVDIQVVDVPKYLILMIIPLGFFFLSLEFIRRFFTGLKEIRRGNSKSSWIKDTPSQTNPKTPKSS